MKLLAKVIIAILIILIIGIGVSEFLLPKYFEAQIEAALLRYDQNLEFLQVDLKTRPALLFLLGRVQQGKIEMRGLKIDQVRIEEIRAEYQDLVLKLEKGALTAVQGENLDFQAIFLEEDLNNYLATAFPQFDQVQIDLQPETVLVKVKYANFVNMEIPGYIEVGDDYKLRFVPQNIDQLKLSSLVVSQLLSFLEFDLGIKDYPLPLDLKEIKIESGKLVALGGSKYLK